jgi:hypothetical protein
LRSSSGTARVSEGLPEESDACGLVFEKYQTRDEFEEWRDSALPVAIELIE